MRKRVTLLVALSIFVLSFGGNSLAAMTDTAAANGDGGASPFLIWAFAGVLVLAVVGMILSRVRAANHRQQVQELMEEIEK